MIAERFPSKIDPRGFELTRKNKHRLWNMRAPAASEQRGLPRSIVSDIKKSEEKKSEEKKTRSKNHLMKQRERNLPRFIVRRLKNEQD